MKNRVKLGPTNSRSNGLLRAPVLNIKVVGVGGGGGNAVSRISRDFLRGVDFVAVNTDHQDLDHCTVRKKVYIGRNLTKGLGAGMNPDLGRQAAEENRSDIAEAVRDADLVFLAAGLGGGTGSGTTPIVAEVARQQGALTVAFVTKPFSFEGSQRQRIAEDALGRLKDKVDALVVIPNDRIFSVIDKDTPILKAFEAIDGVIRQSLYGLVELIMTPGIINVDFADVRAIMQDSGSAIVGVGFASGQDRAVNAVTQAIHSPLLEMSAEGAQSVLLGIAGGRDLGMNEVNEAAKLVAQTVDPNARIIFGAYHDRKLKPNQVKITLVASSFTGQSPSVSLFSGLADKAGLSRSGAFRDDLKSSAGDGLKRRDTAEELLFVKKEPAPGATDEKEEKAKKKTESDLWDIPTFLRRKKR